jgi:hypothetical protein
VVDCVACEKGRYNQVKASHGCKICAKGTYQDATGQTTCENCTAGRYLIDDETDATFHDSVEDCAACEKGQYNQLNASHGCQICAKGTYQDATGQTTCENCTAGRYLSDDRTELILHDNITDCIDCDAGQYSNVVGASSECACQNCAVVSI